MLTITNKPLFALNPSDTIDQLQHTFFPPYITLAHQFRAPEGWGIANRVLKQYQLQYALGGRAEYRIGEQVYLTGPGDLLVHRPNERHAVRTFKEAPYVCVSVVFHFGEAPFPFDDLVTSSHYMGNYTKEQVEDWLSNLILHYRRPGVVSQVQAQSLLLQVLIELNRRVRLNREKEESPRQKHNIARMNLVKNHLVNHYAQPVRIKDLQQLSGFSRDYLIEQFKLVFGVTPMQYVIRLRVEKAKELAVSTGLTISEIAEKVGYSDVHTFGKMFKKKTGCSLSEFCAALFADESGPGEGSS